MFGAPITADREVAPPGGCIHHVQYIFPIAKPTLAPVAITPEGSHW
ncbi:MAG: hypothetical protein L7T82_00940 [SAR324 cluster bacterium]|nr:hypothetical protein [SAR324 cluster bacterium]